MSAVAETIGRAAQSPSIIAAFPPVETSDLAMHLKISVLVSLAGIVAQKRCRRGSAPGWRRLRSADDKRAFHESGHAGISHCLGRHVYSLSIRPQPDIRVGNRQFLAGVCCQGLTLEPPAELYAKRDGPLDRDLRSVAKSASMLAVSLPGRDGWRKTLRVARELRGQCELLVEWLWPLIAPLADRLAVAGVMDQEEIAKFLKPETRGCALRLL
ncbi:MAG TPA: hypothetical protein VML19_17795 [Verrucomicrobiae bacterium]|nr:hypothetical protein [Verrucomicrobiae bacterium]